jgi:hypothetical protein
MSDERTLGEVIRDGMAEAMAAGNQAVWEQFQKDTAGGMEHFTGLAGLSREVLETDAEDHIIRGTD